jgi:hypothetical protein
MGTRAVISKFNGMNLMKTEISWLYKDINFGVISWLNTVRDAMIITYCVWSLDNV